jgi:ABC-type transport system involved in multi-copper enzyme maturation permease subunit
VSQAGVVTRLAVRELWITFRLMMLLVAFVGAGAAVALLPAALPITMQRLAIGLGAATVLVAVIAAWSLADERRQGRAGWLVARSVSRGTLLGGWFVALSSVSLAGLAAAAVLGWLAASGVSLRLDPSAFAVLLGAVASTVVAAAALGLLAGASFRPLLAALVAALLCGVAVAAAWLLPQAGGLVPGSAFLELAALIEGPISVADAWRSAGAALIAAGLLLVLGRVALGRAEL